MFQRIFFVFVVCMCLDATRANTSQIIYELNDIAKAENVEGCRLRIRTDAADKKTIWLFKREALVIDFCLKSGAMFTVDDLVLSNDGGMDALSVTLDGKEIGIVTSLDGTDFGRRWDIFIHSWKIGDGTALEAGEHRLQIEVAESDAFGVELDFAALGFNGSVTADDIRCEGAKSHPPPAGITGCSPSIEFGLHDHPCSTDDDCVLKNTICRVDSCACADGFDYDRGADVCSAFSLMQNVTCTDNSACHIGNSVCRDGLCDCTAGYSFDHDSNTCVLRCERYGPHFSQQTTNSCMQEYKATILSGVTSLETCKDRCRNALFPCRSLQIDSEGCHLSEKTLQDVKPSMVVNKQGCNYYERNCA